jgi:predicted GTPase
LGGYERKKYRDASLLFVTFAIKKHPNETEIEKAKAWQEKFVEYVKNYDDKDLQLAYVPIELPVRRLDKSIEY